MPAQEEVRQEGFTGATAPTAGTPDEDPVELPGFARRAGVRAVKAHRRAARGAVRPWYRRPADPTCVCHYRYRAVDSERVSASGLVSATTALLADPPLSLSRPDRYESVVNHRCRNRPLRGHEELPVTMA